MALRIAILKDAVTLVPTLGFTRTAMSQAAANVCSNQELPNRSIDHIFGRGDDARKTLIRAWLDKGREAMAVPNAAGVNVKDSLQRRLEWNTPVLDKLPEAFALLATPSGAFPSIDARAVLEHPLLVAHTACRLAQHDPSGMTWYARRAVLGSIYAAAELHQLNSPESAGGFLESLLDSSMKASSAASEVLTFANYIGRSWLSIAKSKGLV